MDVATVISAIKESITHVHKLQKITKKLEQAEAKAALAELANHLADAKLKMAELKEQIATLQDQNDALRSRTDGKKPSVKWGCYIFDEDDTLYCPACFDTKGKKHLTTRVDSRRRQCSVCHTTLFS